MELTNNKIINYSLTQLKSKCFWPNHIYKVAQYTLNKACKNKFYLKKKKKKKYLKNSH